MVRRRYTIVISTMQNMVTVITITFWLDGSSNIGTTPSGGSSAGPLRLSSLCSGPSKEKSMNEIQPQMNSAKFYRRCGKRGRGMTEIRGKSMLGDRYVFDLGTVISRIPEFKLEMSQCARLIFFLANNAVARSYTIPSAEQQDEIHPLIGQNPCHGLRNNYGL